MTGMDERGGAEGRVPDGAEGAEGTDNADSTHSTDSFGGVGDEARATAAGPRASGADEVARYAAAVRAELADLPAAAVAELLEDLEDHLGEVAAEDGGDLRERLGSPAAYAAELRASAGLPERGDGPVPVAAAGVPGAKKRRRTPKELVAGFERWLRTQWLGREFLDFLPLLRPAWWVARAWLVVYLLQLVTSGDSPAHDVWIVPRPGGSAFIGMLMLLVTVPASIWLARRPPFEGRRAQFFAAAQGVLGVLAAVAVLHSTSGGNSYLVSPAGYVGPGGLNQAGRPITNLYVYDQSGKLLTGVYVYDQNGNPVVADPGEDGNTVTQTYVDADGAFVGNVYPAKQARFAYGPDGNQVLVPIRPPAMVAVPQGVQPDGTFPGGGSLTVPGDSPSGAPTTSAGPSAAGPSAGASTNPSSGASANQAPVTPVTPSTSGTSTPTASGTPAAPHS